MPKPSDLLADDPRRIPIDPERLQQLDYAQRIAGKPKKGIYNAELKGPQPLWKQIIGGLMSDPGLSPGPLGMASLNPEAEALLGRIAARNTLQHSTNPEGALGALEDKFIKPGGFAEKILGWGEQKRPYLSGRNAGYTTPGPSFSRAQRYGDAVTFEFPAESIRSRPGQGLEGSGGSMAEGKPGRSPEESLKSFGKFEYENVTDAPVDVSKARRIFINRGRIGKRYDVGPTDKRVQDVVDNIRRSASQYNIPVIEGNSEQELMQYRVKYPQFP